MTRDEWVNGAEGIKKEFIMDGLILIQDPDEASAGLSLLRHGVKELDELHTQYLLELDND